MPVKTSKTSAGSKMPPKLRLKIANECDDLSTRVKIQTQRTEFKFNIVSSKDVSEQIYVAMMDLFEPLMHDYYANSSWGWNKEEKLSEWTHARTRMILVTKKDSCDTGSGNIVFNKLPHDDDKLVGFMCFRFESGSDKNECALYVYELHVHPDFQRQGLGEELMRMAKHFATETKMDKVMLTVFRSNSQALQFYNKLNYVQDKSSPAKNEADYLILSIKIKN